MARTLPSDIYVQHKKKYGGIVFSSFEAPNHKSLTDRSKRFKISPSSFHQQEESLPFRSYIRTVEVRDTTDPLNQTMSDHEKQVKHIL